jgi:hypothetical protein
LAAFVAGRGVGAAVPAPAAAVAVHGRIEAEVEAQLARVLLHVELDMHEERVRARVDHVIGDDPVLPVRRCARDLAGHPAVVERAGCRGHVARLKIREGRAVRDDVLQGLDVRVVDRRVVDVAEHAVRDGEPHLRRGVARRPEAVLAREVEVRERTGGSLRVGDRDS